LIILLKDRILSKYARECNYISMKLSTQQHRAAATQRRHSACTRFSRIIS
jgi:hypothetical protein